MISEGEVDVIVNNANASAGIRREFVFGVLNTGSCFCAHSFITDDAE
jgi:hypothetical protein